MVAASLGAQVTIIERAGLGGSAVLTDVRACSARIIMPSSPTSPGVGIPVTSGWASTHDTAAVMRAWSS